jgi:hypothetical protein
VHQKNAQKLKKHKKISPFNSHVHSLFIENFDTTNTTHSITFNRTNEECRHPITTAQHKDDFGSHKIVSTFADLFWNIRSQSIASLSHGIFDRLNLFHWWIDRSHPSVIGFSIDRLYLIDFLFLAGALKPQMIFTLLLMYLRPNFDNFALVSN